MHNCRVTEQLYYKDTTILEFPARVDRVVREDGRTVATLDQTAFYPEGGGQPADRGTLNGRTVAHVRKDQNGISHVLADPSPGETEFEVGDTVTGVVDSAHRLDYMQQHTGQHIISAALVKVGGYNTVSVHLGAEYTTIEVDAPSVSVAELNAVEELANSTIERAIPVVSEWVTDAEISSHPLRRPPKVSGSIRLVTIGDMDCVACGGVHVDNTGKVRLVHAISTESIRGRARVSWKIGDRAIADYRMTSSVVRGLGEYLSAQPQQIDERVRRQEDRIRDTETALKRERGRIYRLIADSLISDEETHRGRRTITAEFLDEEKELLRGVSKVLSEQTGVAACLTNRLDDQRQWSIVIAPGAGVEYGELRDELFPLIEARGGGKPPMWQGMGTNPTAAGAFLAAFKRLADRE